MAEYLQNHYVFSLQSNWTKCKPKLPNLHQASSLHVLSLSIYARIFCLDYKLFCKLRNTRTVFWNIMEELEELRTSHWPNLCNLKLLFGDWILLIILRCHTYASGQIHVKPVVKNVSKLLCRQTRWIFFILAILPAKLDVVHFLKNLAHCRLPWDHAPKSVTKCKSGFFLHEERERSLFEKFIGEMGN